MLVAEGYSIEFNKNGDCASHNTGTTVQLSPCRSDVYLAGTIAHEAMHHNTPGNGSLLEEYIAFMVGDTVRNELIQSGHGKRTDMDRPLSAYTVDILNPNKGELANDLINWFKQNRLGIYVRSEIQGGYGTPPLPLEMTRGH